MNDKAQVLERKNPDAVEAWQIVTGGTVRDFASRRIRPARKRGQGIKKRPEIGSAAEKKKEKIKAICPRQKGALERKSEKARG